ncbi:hypothetical protein GCM10017687_24030 [Streptomyces echinatus]
MLLETITPRTGTTVGVAMPISVVFTDPVATKARATVEKHMKVSGLAAGGRRLALVRRQARRLAAEDVLGPQARG